LLADPSTLKKKQRNATKIITTIIILLFLKTDSQSLFLKETRDYTAPQMERSPEKNRTRQTSDAAAPGFAREREREREHKTKQSRDGRKKRTQVQQRQLCVPFTAVNWITVRSEIQPIREDKGK
jgi:hypothetical protein